MTIVGCLLLANAFAAGDLWAGGYWARQYGIGAGSAVVLNQPLVVATGSHQAFIQGGMAVPNKVFPFTGGYDQYYPFCYFELRQSAEQSLTIQPGRFTITRVRLEETEVVSLTPVRVASADDGDGGIELVVQALIMELSSQLQPEVEKLVCAEGFDYAGQEELPVLSHIIETLGPVATLELKP